MTEHQADPAPVVLLHGWGGTYQTTWSGSVLERRLRAAGRTVAGLDLPGHGPGPVSHEPKDYELIASQLAMILPHAVVMDGVGFSLGGKLLLQLAAGHPGRFRRLVIGGVGANLFRPENGEVAMIMIVLILWVLAIIVAAAIWSRDPGRRADAGEVLRMILSAFGRRRV